MSQIIDLAAFQPEPLEIKLPSGTIYNIPSSISVKYMTKILNLQQKVGKIENKMEYIPILQNIAFEILSLDKSKEVTMNTIRDELDDIVLLRKLPEIFNDHLSGIIQNSIPHDQQESTKTNPNTITPPEM